MSRVRAPAVTTPTRLPAASTTATVPRFSASRTTHSRIGRSGPRVGTSPASITSATRSSRFLPKAPAGCNAAKSPRPKPFSSSTATASASPSASAAVVLAVGASVSGHASSVTLPSSTTSAWRASTESGSPVSAIMGTPSRFSWLTSPNSSSEAPLFESRSATSCRPTMPRSPCSESTGGRNDAGVPVDVNVAAILRAINPDLPSPETMRRPLASVSRRTARANAGPRRSPARRIASASSASTRRPRSARSPGSVRDIATLQEIFRKQALPFAAGLEDQLRHFPHRALAPGGRRHQPGSGLYFRHAVSHADRQPDAVEERKVRKVVADEGAILPGQRAPLQQRLAGGELARGRILNHLVHLELARAQRRGGRFPSGEPDDEEPGGAEHPDAEAVLDVKPLEFNRVIADHPEVDPVVGEHAVDIQADELQAAGDGGVEHRHFLARARGAAWPSLLTTTPPCPLSAVCAAPLARCQTSSAMLTMCGSWSSGIMFGPSDGARFGSGWVSRKKPSAPAAAAA